MIPPLPSEGTPWSARRLTIDPEADGNGRMTVDRFLVRCEHRPDGARHELVDGRPVEMQAERNRHALVKARVLRLLEDAVLAADLPCTAFPDGVTVAVDEARARLGYHHSRAHHGGDIPTRIVTDGPIELDRTGLSIDLADCFATMDRLERPG